jgi:hypothetical protein
MPAFGSLEETVFVRSGAKSPSRANREMNIDRPIPNLANDEIWDGV